MIKVLIILFAISSLTNGKLNANDSCKIILNKQVIFNGEVDQQNSVTRIKASSFKKSDFLRFTYYTENADKGWNRTFYINDTNDSNLRTVELSKQSGSVTVNASAFNKMVEKKEPLFIYTTSLPTDKAMAARIRVRRIFICKIEWN